jgi:hypothetical protein
MTALHGQFIELRLNTRCGRCVDERNWLTSLTGVDGAQSVHVILCRTPSCHFFEVRSIADDHTIPSQQVGRAERAMRAWRNIAFLSILGWPVIALVVMFLR